MDLGSRIALFYVIMCNILELNQTRSLDLIMVFDKTRGIFYSFNNTWKFVYYICECTGQLPVHAFVIDFSFVYWVHIFLYFYVVDIADIWTVFGFVTSCHRGKAPATQSDVRGTQERQRELGTPRGHCPRTHRKT